MSLKDKIINDIKDNKIILFMKGTKEMPMCGFSNSVVQILSHYGVEYKDVNVLTDPQIRVNLSEYSEWPTIPQLFVNGELVGGADITIELHKDGKLLDILDVSQSWESKKLVVEKLTVLIYFQYKLVFKSNFLVRSSSG